MTPGSVSSPLSSSVSKLVFTRVFLASYHPCILSLHAIPFSLSLSLHHNRGHPMAPYETCGILCLKVSQTYLPSLCHFPLSICLCLQGRMCTRAQLGPRDWTEIPSSGAGVLFCFFFHFAILSASSPLLCSVLCWAGSVYRVSDSNCIGQAASARAKRNTAFFTYPWSLFHPLLSNPHSLWSTVWSLGGQESEVQYPHIGREPVINSLASPL